MVIGGDGRWVVATDWHPSSPQCASCHSHSLSVGQKSTLQAASCQNAAVLLFMNRALNPNPLAKCKRGIRAHVKTAYSQTVRSKKARADSWSHSKWQHPEPSLLLTALCTGVRRAGYLANVKGTWCGPLLALAAEACFLKNRSFPLRAKLSTRSWQQSHAWQVVAML